MNDNELLEKVSELLLDCGLFELPEGNLHAGLDDYGLDSLAIVLFISKIEKEFSIKISTENYSAEKFKNLKEILTFLRELGVQ